MSSNPTVVSTRCAPELTGEAAKVHNLLLKYTSVNHVSLPETKGNIIRWEAEDFIHVAVFESGFWTKNYDSEKYTTVELLPLIGDSPIQIATF